jgi:ParB/RepB/Spo0J family partition protein
MDQIIQLPLTALRESPFNPRKTFAEAALAELAKSIREQGLLQPVVVRPIPETLSDPHAVPRFEIVFGHRRSRAAALAGLDEVTCIVRDMTDQQAAIAQVHENLQRADVSVLEEAESFQHLRHQHGMSADAIADAVSKSRSYVYGRLKLMAGDPAVLAAVRDEALPADIALEIARLPVHGAQRQALKQLRGGGDEAAWPSVRQCQRVIRQMFTIKITQAPWAADDAELLPRAGACISCPHLASNNPAMEGMEADLCLKASCFDEKKAAYIEQQAAGLRAQGHEVITGDQAAEIFRFGNNRYLHGPWTRADEFNLCDELPLEKALEVLTKAGYTTPKPVYGIVPQSGHVVLMYRDSETDNAHADYAELMRKLKIEEGDTSADQAQGIQPQRRTRADDTADWLNAERAFLDYEAVKVIRQRVLQQAKARQRTTDELRLLIVREFEMGGELSGEVAEAFGVGETMLESATDERSALELLEERLAQMSADDLAYLLLGLALHDTVCHVTPYSGRRVAARAAALAQHYDVNPADIAAQLAQQREAAHQQATTQEPAHA